jgi:hypothetical protein
MRQRAASRRARRRVVADGWDVERSVEQAGASEYRPQRVVCNEPTPQRIVPRPFWLGAQRSQKKDIVKADHVLEYTPRVPLRAR